MGTLLDRETNVRHPLATRTIVGRNPTAQLCVRDRRVSNEHAVVWFEEGAWWIRDLRSRNGTTVNDQLLTADEPVQLKAGDLLVFGKPSAQWELAEAGAPTAFAIHQESGRTLRAEDGLLLIPEAENPFLAVFGDGMGGWIIESDGTSHTGEKIEDVVVDGEVWSLVLPFENMQTWTDPTAAPQPCGLHFFVSSDEEHVEIEIRGARTERLPARTHAYFLLILARQRIEDAASGLSPAEVGWLHVEDLCKMLRIDRSTLNQRVFRARQQLARTGLFPAAEVIERRSQSGQLRIGTPFVSEGRFG